MNHKAHIDTLLVNTSRSLLEIYFEIQDYVEDLYGPNTIVLIEVGSFFEVYGVDNETEKRGKPKEVAEILNMQLTRKNKTIAENSVKNPLMAGFPVATFDRYVSRLLQEKKYTLAIIRQRGTPPAVERYLDRILSPGVNFDYSLDHNDNYITSIVIEKHSDRYAAGYAAIDITTGKSSVFEVHGNREDKTLALDELFQLLQTHQGEELLLTCTEEKTQEEVLSYLEKQGNQNTKLNKSRLKITYQNELFKHTYAIESFLSPIEFLDLERKPLASEALAHVIEFIVAHDAAVVTSLAPPTVLSTEQLLYLGNNPLEQLSICSRIPGESTIFSLVDYTATSIGRRLLKERLLNPICNSQTLDARYTLVEKLAPIATTLSSTLKRMYDIERIMRRIAIGRLHPFEINFLFDTISATAEMMGHIERLESNPLPQFLDEQRQLDQCLTYIEKTFDLSLTTEVMTKDIYTTIFQPGVDTELDALLATKQEQEEKLLTIRNAILALLESHTGKAEPEYVAIKQLDKEGHYIHMTKSRYFIIEQALQKQFVSVDGTVHAFSDFSVKVQKTNVKIRANIIDEISEAIIVLQQKIIARTKELYAQQLQVLHDTYTPHLEQLVAHISSIDVAVCTYRAATALNLVRPEIIEHESAVLEIAKLRHPLVEKREENGLYVPNDIVLGDKQILSSAYAQHPILQTTKDDTRGVLLYGINSSGKSSLMKSIGVAVVLAQAGFFVPAARMRYTLFQELFTRIVAKDNFEKGLSSFAVEMMELKNIFNRATKKSLILGDEISHGTETLSAIAIVSATIERLSEIGSLFIFTTHLHQLNEVPSLKKQTSVARVHLAVHYDEEQDALIFDRTLQAGNGSSIYGLEFAQSLHMDQAFLHKAMHIRKALANDFTALERLTQKERSTYNTAVYLSVCAICDNAVDDTHHIEHQQRANEQGFIGHIPKDHKYNLLPICKQCHQQIHDGHITVTGFKMTSKGLQLRIAQGRENK